jgi:transposase-like protein
MLNAKKGLSACQAARDIELRRPTVWSMMHRIRNGMKDNSALLSGIVEMDETYVGGKPRKENRKDDDDNTPSSRGRGTKKTPVVGMVEREGEVRTQVASKYELKAKDLHKIIRSNIDVKNALLVTDEYTGYNRMNDILPHEMVNHSKEYARGDIHTNTIESFWAILKRGITGQFHWVSKKYLQNYLYEFEFKYNNRSNKANITFENMLGRMCYGR